MKKILWFLARDAFLFAISLVLIAVVIGQLLFYTYIMLPEVEELHGEGVAKFQEKTYNSIIEEWAKREAMFANLSSLNYQNPF